MKTETTTKVQERNLIKVTGKEFENTKTRIIKCFQAIIDMGYREGRFPHWGDSVSQLMENAWLLWKWHAIQDPKTGKPMKLHDIAEQLCRNLHVKMPSNVSYVAHKSMQSGRQSVVDYYAMLYRDRKYDVRLFIHWIDPPTWPKITSYRGLFDR